MPPVRSYMGWNMRPTDEETPIEPYRKYYFICEGRNTERWYFEKLIDMRKMLRIHSEVSLVYLEKTGRDENLSNPAKLIEFAEEQKRNGAIDFDRGFDKMIIVFDADIYEETYQNYDELVEKGLKHNILGVTNPSFELFLLLHYDNAVERFIVPNKKAIVENEWVGTGIHRKRYVHWLFCNISQINSKKNSLVGSLATNVKTAIEQEKLINQDISHCKGVVTSNIGRIIETIMHDNPEI